MTSGYPPPAVGHDAETVRVLRAILATLQVLCALVAIGLLIFAGWLLGVFPEWLASPVVQVRI